MKLRHTKAIEIRFLKNCIVFVLLLIYLIFRLSIKGITIISILIIVGLIIGLLYDIVLLKYVFSIYKDCDEIEIKGTVVGVDSSNSHDYILGRTLFIHIKYIDDGKEKKIISNPLYLKRYLRFKEKDFSYLVGRDITFHFSKKDNREVYVKNLNLN